jgi:hypothetical protein
MKKEMRRKTIFICETIRNKYSKMKIHWLVNDTNGVNYRMVFDFELIFYNQENLFWVERFMYNWWWLSIPYGLLYIIAIFIGQAWMKKRNKKFELRKALIVWNSFLTIFSFWGACRCTPLLLHVLTHHGFLYSVCDSSFKNGISGLW